MKELGKLLFKAQMTEEIHECGTDDNCQSKLKKNPSFDFKLGDECDNTASIQYLSAKITTAIHLADRLPNHHVPDIFTPPPNC